MFAQIIFILVCFKARDLDIGNYCINGNVISSKILNIGCLGVVIKRIKILK